MDKVRIGIIGYGNMGSAHAQWLKEGKVPNAVLAAVCDNTPEKLEKARGIHGEAVKYYTSTDEFFAAKVVDAIIIATPHYFHPPLAMAGFKHGLHVMSEKPAGVYTKQVREMNEAADKSDRVFGIMFNQRTLPHYQKLRDLVSSGELGALKRTNWIITDWFRSQAYYDSGGWRATWSGEGGGVLINQCPHNLDLFQWICGLPKRVRAICGFGKYHQIEVDDDVTAFVEYENGATGVFITSTGEAPGTNRLEITCDRGKIVLEGGKITFWRTRTPVAQFCRETKEGFATPETWVCEVPARGEGEQHVGILKNFASAILSGGKLLAPGQEGINGLQLGNAILLSSWTDAWVDIPVNETLFYDKLQEKIKQSKVGKKEVKGGSTSVAGTFGS